MHGDAPLTLYNLTWLCPTPHPPPTHTSTPPRPPPPSSLTAAVAKEQCGRWKTAEAINKAVNAEGGLAAADLSSRPPCSPRWWLRERLQGRDASALCFVRLVFMLAGCHVRVVVVIGGGRWGSGGWTVRCSYRYRGDSSAIG